MLIIPASLRGAFLALLSSAAPRRASPPPGRGRGVADPTPSRTAAGEASLGSTPAEVGDLGGGAPAVVRLLLAPARWAWRVAVEVWAALTRPCPECEVTRG